MPKATVTKVTITCDICSEPIVVGYYVDAMAYGVTTHEGCWERANGAVIAKLLGLDDIVIRWVLDDSLIHGVGKYGDRG